MITLGLKEFHQNIEFGIKLKIDVHEMYVVPIEITLKNNSGYSETH